MGVIADEDGEDVGLGQPLSIAVETMVWTERSCWVFRPDLYMRLPLLEGPRWAFDSPRLRDHVWMQQAGVTWATDQRDHWWLRVRPKEGPSMGRGIETGVVQRVAYR